MAEILSPSGSRSFTVTFAEAVAPGNTRKTVVPVEVIAADVIMLNSVPALATPLTANTTEGVAVTAVTLIIKNPHALLTVTLESVGVAVQLGAGKRESLLVHSSGGRQ